MTQPPFTLDDALAHFRAGRYADAQRVAEKLASADPNDARALHVAGAAAAQAGDSDRGIECLRLATQADPDFADAWIDLGRLLTIRSRDDEDDDDDDEALACLVHVCRLRPDPQRLFDVADLLRHKGRREDAIAYLEQASSLPACDALLHCRVSQSLTRMSEYGRAEVAARAAIALRPELAEAHTRLGIALHQQNRLEEAEAEYRAAIDIDPRLALNYSLLGDLLGRAGRLDEAEAACRRAIDLAPASAVHRIHQATVLSRLERMDEAIASANRATELEPDNYLAHATAGQLLLCTGRFAEGWPRYEWRIRGWVSEPTGRQTWDGSPLQGRPIVVRCEQGAGDSIQFVRYAPLLLRERGAGRVIVECPRELKPVLATAVGVDQVVAWGEPPASGATLEIWMLSLPHRFATTLDTIPAAVPYLRPDPERVQCVRARIPGDVRFKVGVVWAGNPAQLNDRQRSCPLSALRPLIAGRADISFYSLQNGAAWERDKALASSLGMIDLGSTLDLSDLAAAIMWLDLLLTVDTAPAHLGGALARPVWTILPRTGDWRWLEDRSDSPWYPTMRLFRQASPGDWPGVVADVARALDSLTLKRA